MKFSWASPSHEYRRWALANYNTGVEQTLSIRLVKEFLCSCLNVKVSGTPLFSSLNLKKTFVVYCYSGARNPWETQRWSSQSQVYLALPRAQGIIPEVRINGTYWCSVWLQSPLMWWVFHQRDECGRPQRSKIWSHHPSRPNLSYTWTVSRLDWVRVGNMPVHSSIRVAYLCIGGSRHNTKKRFCRSFWWIRICQ